ncbi:MAG: glyoxalase/bleomycin resistance/dioxygenase family protein [Pseudomonadales bacterium]|nr:glyoxalase/bleomycin resistance/dioxygenase family protein [Pseudomonadales bacterium]
MKRLRMHVGVDDLDASVRFYGALFETEAVRQEADYARWLLDDPRVNFAVSLKASTSGVDHLGIQVEDEIELAEIHGRLEQAVGPIAYEGETHCCYARPSKRWTDDPAGISWEAFVTHGEDATRDAATAPAGGCCA